MRFWRTAREVEVAAGGYWNDADGILSKAATRTQAGLPGLTRSSVAF